MRALTVILAATLLLPGCSDPQEPKAETSQSSQPIQAQTAPAPKPVSIQAPAGQYKLDRNHANLSFGIMHLNLAPYIARFSDFDVTIDLDPQNLGASTVRVSIDPASVAVDYSGDYKSSHQDSPYASWQEDLAQSPKFFNAGQHPAISFISTSVKPTDAGTLAVTGDLSLLGQTNPVTLDVEVTGDLATHPFTGNGALGFTATGKLRRSEFGMMHLLEPPLLGDEVTVRFSGEFHQVVQQVPEEAASEAE